MNRKRFKILLGAVVFVIIAIAFYFQAAATNGSGNSPAAFAASSSSSSHDESAASTQHSAQAQGDEDADDEEAPTVEIPEDKQRLIGVRTTEVAVQALEKTIRTVGRVDYDERRIATVNTKFGGWIEKLHVDYTGRYVKKGEPLAEIYSPELVATQRELLSLSEWQKGKGQTSEGSYASMVRTDTAALLDAARQRLKYWDITEGQIRSIEETGKTVRTLTLYSPVSGYVIQKMALEGMRVMPGEKLFDIADLSMLWVLADIYESELPYIKEGQSARITLSYFPEKEYRSRIEFVYPVLAGETRTVKARFSVPNSGGSLKPQMFTNVEIRVSLGRKLVIPEDAVIDTGTRKIVYVDLGDEYFEPREIITGIKSGGYFEVLKGLKAGEKVASSATFLVDSEAKLKGIVPLGSHAH